LSKISVQDLGFEIFTNTCSVQCGKNGLSTVLNLIRIRIKINSGYLSYVICWINNVLEKSGKTYGTVDIGTAAQDRITWKRLSWDSQHQLLNFSREDDTLRDRERFAL